MFCRCTLREGVALKDLVLRMRVVLLAYVDRMPHVVSAHMAEVPSPPEPAFRPASDRRVNNAFQHFCVKVKAIL